MPGLAGIIAATGSPDYGATLDLMAESMMHEKSYRCCKVHLPESGIWIAWNGHNGSFSDCMPVWNENKDILLMFTGEVFPTDEEIRKLRSADHTFAADDASHLVHLYEDHGDNFVEMLNGTFAGVIVDKRTHRVLLFNDRYALSRIYYHDDGSTFWFASEAKALLRVNSHLRRFDQQGLAEFFGCGCTLQERSLFSGVSLLPPAARWSFDHTGSPRRDTYFRVESWAEQDALSPSEFQRQYAETLAATVPRYFSGRQQVAVSLTGGLDSRLVAAWAPHTPFLIPCYTFSGMYNKCHDALIAERVARQWQQHHQVIRLERSFFADFPALAKRSVFYSDGAQDVTGAASLFVNKLAREIAPVRVTGNYGDEVMRDNTTLKSASFREGILAREFATMVRSAVVALATEDMTPRLSFILRKQVPWLHYARLAVEQTQLTVRTPFLDNDIVRLQFRWPPVLKKSVDLALRLIAAGDPRMSRIPTDRGHIGPRRWIWHRHREWWQALLTRAEYFYDYGMPHACVGRCENIGRWNIERLFLGRHKYYHFRTWYRSELAPYVKEMLLDSRALDREHLDRRAVERIVTSHTMGYGNYTQEIHKLLTYELTHRQFIDSSKWS